MRAYQEAAADGVLRAFETHRSALAVLPTGLGKTVLFAEVIRRMHERGARALVLAHREELITQAADKIARVTGLECGIEMGLQRVRGWFGRLPPVIVSTVQTQCSGERMQNFKPDDFGLVVIDEAHHATSGTYGRCIEHYLANPAARLLGVTATPDRADEHALGRVFATVAYQYDIQAAIAEGWLVPISQQIVTVGTLDFSGIKTTAGDLNQGQLARVLEAERNLHGIAGPTVEICGDRRAIVFAASVAQAEKLAEILNRYRPDRAAWVCGKTDKDERRNILADFKKGRLQFVVNVGVLTEGFDDAGVEVVVMGRPTKSRALYAQMAGRATRPAAEIAGLLGDHTAADRVALIKGSSKPACLIVDFVGNAGRHKLISTADILGGRYDADIVQRVAERVRANGGEVDVAAELEKVKEEKAKREERKKREAARRAQVRASRAEYRVDLIDPFDRYQLARVASQSYDRQPSEKMRALLLRWSINPDGLTFAQARRIISQRLGELNAGGPRLASEKQLAYLRALGYDGATEHLTSKEASQLIDSLKQAREVS